VLYDCKDQKLSACCSFVLCMSCKDLEKLSASCCSFVLKCKEEGSSELRRSSKVRVIEALCCNYLTKIK
jgi:hypothetical protein